MAFRILSLSLFLLAGCASLDRKRGLEPTKEPVKPLARSLPATDQHTGKSSSEIRLVQHEEPFEPDADSPPSLLRSPATREAGTETLQPRTIAEAMNPPEVLSESDASRSTIVELDLTRALAMASGQNPRIAFAAARYREAYARLESAQALWLPSIRAGVSFNHHDGTLQASSGQVLDASRSSLQGGLGGRAVGAGSPAVPGVLAQFHASDAVFQPKIAAHAASARDAAVETATNDTLLATALAYLDLLRATQQRSIAKATRDNAQKLSELTSTFARSGQGPQADADRTLTELVRRKNDVSRAHENVRVASARLAELLSLEPSAEISPQESTIVPVDLVERESPAAQLVATGLANRPELAEAQYLVCEAVYRYRREKYAPLLPSILLGVSQSDFGGGFGSRIDNTRGRFDFDASAFWELRNFGFGERARRDETRSRYDQARALQMSAMDRVAREVVEAHAQVTARRGQIDVAKSGVKAATDSYGRSLARIRQGQGLPIEVLQSLQALDEARREYLRTLVDYNESQFRLQRALGWPIH